MSLGQAKEKKKRRPLFSNSNGITAEIVAETKKPFTFLRGIFSEPKTRDDDDRNDDADGKDVGKDEKEEAS